MTSARALHICKYIESTKELTPCIFDKAEPDAPDFVSSGRCNQCVLEWLRKEVG